MSSESDLVTPQGHSVSPRARLSHVMISPPTHPIDFTCNAHLASPLPLASCLHRSSFPSFLSFAIQTLRHKPCRCHTIRPPSPPDDARAPLDTGQVTPCTSRSTPRWSNVPARDIHSSDLQLFMGSLASFPYVFICLVSLFSIVALYLSSTFAAPFCIAE